MDDEDYEPIPVEEEIDVLAQTLQKMLFARNISNTVLGVDVPEEEKVQFEESLDMSEFTQEELDEYIGQDIIKYNIRCHADGKDSLGRKTITDQGVFKAANACTMHIITRVANQMVDEGIMDMVTDENGDIQYVKKKKPKY